MTEFQRAAVRWLYDAVLVLLFVRMVLSALAFNVAGALIALVMFACLLLIHDHQRRLGRI